MTDITKTDEIILLKDVQVGESCVIEACTSPLKTRNKLETLGLIPKEMVRVVQNTGAGVIVEAKNSRLAIAQSLAKSIEVSL